MDLAFKAVIFDLDGVITKTAKVHASAWKAMFDEYLKLRQERDGESFKEFTHEHDYLPFVDGKPRYEGVKSFLESRQIHIPFGEVTDKPDKETVCGLGNKKNIKFVEVLEKDGIEVYSSTVELMETLKKNNIHVGVASSSKNCELVLKKTGIDRIIETRVDGVVSAELGLKGKPEGDIFVKAAENMGVDPSDTIVVEDAVSGVQAGKNGKFGLVIGIARENNESDLLTNGAHFVIDDFESADLEKINSWFKSVKS